MPFWNLLVDAIRLALFTSAHVLGGSAGAGILAFSLIVRIALLPITLRAARQMRDLQAARRLDPKAPPPRNLGSLIQLPIGLAMYQAVSTSSRGKTAFLW